MYCVFALGFAPVQVLKIEDDSIAARITLGSKQAFELFGTVIVTSASCFIMAMMVIFIQGCWAIVCAMWEERPAHASHIDIVDAAATAALQAAASVQTTIPPVQRDIVTEYELKENSKIVRCIGTVDDDMADVVYEVVRIAEDTKCDILDVVVHSTGGSKDRCKDIYRILQRFPGKTRVWIPSFASSAGCLIALALLSKGPVYVRKGTRISPIDAQINGLSMKMNDAIVAITKERAPPEIIAAQTVYKQSDVHQRKLIANVLHDCKLDEKKIDNVIYHLVSGEFDHQNTSFDDQEMSEMGLPVSHCAIFPPAILSLSDWKLSSADGKTNIKTKTLNTPKENGSAAVASLAAAYAAAAATHPSNDDKEQATD